MRILIHDYPGHAFPIQLSRQLAVKGHQVLHVYAGYNVTPRGIVESQKDDPAGFTIRPLYIRKPLNKYNFVKRWRQEREYGRLLAKEIMTYEPGIIISANTPLDAQKMAMDAAFKVQSRFVFWLQDVIGMASKRLLTERLSFAGSLIGEYYLRLERNMLRASDHIVLITEDFLPLMQSWSIPQTQLSVIPNWAVLDDLPVQQKNNDWARMNNLEDKFCFLYAGTMGLKHNPDFLLQLALHYRNIEDVRVVVISEGPGAAWLLKQREIYGLDNLLVLNFQPFQSMPEVLGAADVLVALLKPDAGVYSVPSKVLTYLCAQRPLLLAVPPENLAARIVKKQDAGLVVTPDSPQTFVQSANRLYMDPNLRGMLAGNGRRYAERKFHINEISDKFEAILERKNS